MKKLFGIALLALPFVVTSAHATGHFFNIQAGGTLYIKGGPGLASPQAGPWYLYWPLEAHFVAPAPTGYPYWPGPQVLPPTTIGAPAYPAGVPVAPPPVATAPAAAAAVPSYAPAPAPAAPVQVPAPRTTPQAVPQGMLPPYLQPTSYYAAPYRGQAPSYWYDR